MIRRILTYPQTIIDKILNAITFSLKKIDRNNISVNGRIRIYGKGKIIIGDSTRINSSLSSNPIGGQSYSLFVVDANAVLEIGQNAGLSNTTIVCRERVSIGSNVLIGGSSKIYDTDFHSIYSYERNNYKDKGQSASIQIRNGAFIGAHCIILKGVTIGENSVVGAGSVVTKNIPDNQVWAGNPAKFVKSI